ncbi:uncharacterized protein METZ01_LOCUS415601 [marine metagenome]|uniref:Uncharacterized protein n=1 Tax=marine metagenome TaxID=408172 RepID=A0A382WV52_9ZZZZ
MDSFDAFQDEEFEQLNEAILKAIISSRDVEKVLQDFKCKDLINEMAVVNLILSLEELSGLMFSGSPDKRMHNLEPLAENQPLEKQQVENQMVDNTTKKNSCTSSSHYLVDGKVLSRNEILFEKYYQGLFNEKQWLKRAKIRI